MSSRADAARPHPTSVVRWGRADVVLLLGYLLLADRLGLR